MKKDCWFCVGVAGLAGSIVVGNTLYKIASRNGVPMFSYDALVLGLPYWIGYALGIVAIGGYWLYRRAHRNDA